MKSIQDTYTVRDLSRRTAEVLEAAGELGAVTIRARNGQRFDLKPQLTEDKPFFVPDFEARWNRLKKLGYEIPPPEEVERLDRMIAGEE